MQSQSADKQKIKLWVVNLRQECCCNVPTTETLWLIDRIIVPLSIKLTAIPPQQLVPVNVWLWLPTTVQALNELFINLQIGHSNFEEYLIVKPFWRFYQRDLKQGPVLLSSLLSLLSQCSCTIGDLKTQPEPNKDCCGWHIRKDRRRRWIKWKNSW